jgi:hypothetical protein
MKDKEQQEAGVTSTAAHTQAAEQTPAATTSAAAQEGTQQSPVAFPYAAAGAAFTAWFNDKLRRLSNPTILLGTKRARVLSLDESGRLSVEVETDALEPDRQFVAFEGSHLDQLVRKITALGL